MDSTPADILRLIFQVYVNDLKRSPIGLLTVSRRWHAILISTRTFWTRVTINIDSFDVIPYITQAKTYSGNQEGEGMDGVEAGSGVISPLRSYLDRSCSSDGSVQLPLDIKICWFPHENYKSPPHYITMSGRNLAPRVYYGNGLGFIPYFTREDYYGCSLQMQLLLLSLAGICIHLFPCGDESKEQEQEQENGEDNVQRGAIQIAEEEEGKTGRRFEQLEWALDDIKKYSLDRPFRPESQYCTAFLARDDTLRWRSLHFDLLQVAGSVEISLPTDVISNLGRNQLTSLESITLKGVHFAYYNPSGTPSLRYLEIMQSLTTKGLNMETLRVLRIGRGALKATMDYLQWNSLRRLHTLEIMEPMTVNKLWWQYTMEQLETVFTESHPLASFSISPWYISEIVALFNRYSGFRVKVLNVASQHLDSLKIPPQAIAGIRRMLQEMDRKGIIVLPVDAEMRNILELAQGR